MWLRLYLLQIRALSSEQNSTAGLSWQMSHCTGSAAFSSLTLSCLAANLLAPWTLEDAQKIRQTRNGCLACSMGACCPPCVHDALLKLSLAALRFSVVLFLAPFLPESD